MVDYHPALSALYGIFRELQHIPVSIPLKLTPEVWSEIPVLKRDTLPNNMDGNMVYELSFDHNRMASSKDEWRWQRYMSSTRSGFKGIRRLARCSGSYKCTNSLCSFHKQGRPNLTHFDKASACKFCGNSADFVPCSASKVWEFNDCCQSDYHHGYHTCPVIVKPDEKAVWDDIDCLTERLIDPYLPKNVKQKVRKELHPEGHSFEAVQLLKTKLDKKDPLYIFDMNDSRFHSDRPTFVFSTSQEKMLLALKMKRNSKFPLEKEYYHFDGKHGRVRGMKTLTASVFHPLLGKMVRLAVMHCKYEDSTNVALFWQLFNKALQAASQNPMTTFQPYGYMMDEGGAEWARLQRECGEQEVEVAKSCQFHYRQAVNREARKLNSSTSKFEFKKIANTMLIANSPSAYDKVYGKMVAFIKEKPTKRSFFKSWIDWWDERKQHVLNAFCSLPFARTTNLSECLHSSWETTREGKAVAESRVLC
ncbi:Hypothetical predicted protein [Paramuricea clavata]|uniref:Uncharacterized protein n=1 Tax=Paramuricea clavata TaxID=317549 RepID=A0A6S7G001_PARCT|nr:Hypothetical predicted protein [Paramuricea clavata]